MSLLSLLVFITLILLTTVKTNAVKEKKISKPTVQNFKEYVTTMIKKQSSKIQTLLKKIQTNAKSVLNKIENMKQVSNSKDIKYAGLTLRPFNVVKSPDEEHQVEAPILKKNLDTSENEVNTESRSFSNHYGTSSYGVSGNANYGTPAQTYHHHSIGFDPINIVVSVSLLSFLLQAIQGLLSRTRLPTQVVEARYLNPVQDWFKKFENKHVGVAPTKPDYQKRKYPKKYI